MVRRRGLHVVRRTGRQEHLHLPQSLIHGFALRLSLSLVLQQALLGRLEGEEGVGYEGPLLGGGDGALAAGGLVSAGAAVHLVVLVSRALVGVPAQLSARIRHPHRPVVVHRGDGHRLHAVLALALVRRLVLVLLIEARRLHVHVLVDAAGNVAQLLAAGHQLLQVDVAAGTAARQEQILVVARPDVAVRGEGHLGLQVGRRDGEVATGRLLRRCRLQSRRQTAVLYISNGGKNA